MEKYRILVKGIVQYDDQFLVMEKWYDDRIVDPYQWEFIDGELDFGEAPEMAVKRTVKEQTGIEAEPEEVLYTWGFTIGEICTIGIAFRMLAENDEVTLSEDHRDYKWVPKEQLLEVITNEKIREDIDKAGLTRDFDIGDFGKVDTFIEHFD